MPTTARASSHDRLQRILPAENVCAVGRVWGAKDNSLVGAARRCGRSRRWRPLRNGSFRLFRIAGIDLYLHWSWFVVAMYEISSGTSRYSSPIWMVLGVSDAVRDRAAARDGPCAGLPPGGRTGESDRVGPLGGVAYALHRPGRAPRLWSIAAGPLVNVALLPVLYFSSGK